VPQRFDRLDAARALAIAWMAIYHLFFDLNHFGFIRQNFYADPVWTVQRTAILSMFLVCVGVGQAVATERAQDWPSFWRRWLQVAACALLVSAGTYLTFPRSFIYFGVLHGIALMMIVLRLTSSWGRWLWLLGLLALLLPLFVAHPLFDSRWTNWTGFVTRKPVTGDYVPLFPWLGVMWWGFAGGQWLLRRRRGWLAGPLPARFEPMAVLGRWSLAFYMLHQPVLMGLLMAFVALRGR